MTPHHFKIKGNEDLMFYKFWDILFREKNTLKHYIIELPAFLHLPQYCPPEIIYEIVLLTELHVKEVENYFLIFLVVYATKGWQPCIIFKLRIGWPGSRLADERENYRQKYYLLFFQQQHNFFFFFARENWVCFDKLCT